MSGRRRLAAWFALGAALVVIAVVVVARSGDESDEQRAQRLARELACPVCVGESVAASNAPEARAMRRIIHERIDAGDTDTEIKAFFVDAYGEGILLVAGRGGLGLLAWGLPVLLIAGAGGALGVALWRWSRAPRLRASDADEELVARLRRDRTATLRHQGSNGGPS